MTQGARYLLALAVSSSMLGCGSEGFTSSHDGTGGAVASVPKETGGVSSGGASLTASSGGVDVAVTDGVGGRSAGGASPAGGSPVEATGGAVSTGGVVGSGGFADGRIPPAPGVTTFKGPDGTQWVCAVIRYTATMRCQCQADSPEFRASLCDQGYDCATFTSCPEWGMPACCVNPEGDLCLCRGSRDDHCLEPERRTCP